jgi:hypothetical protein
MFIFSPFAALPHPEPSVAAGGSFYSPVTLTFTLMSKCLQTAFLTFTGHSSGGFLLANFLSASPCIPAGLARSSQLRFPTNFRSRIAARRLLIGGYLGLSSFVRGIYITPFFLLSNTTTIDGNGAELMLPPNFKRPRIKVISPSLQ